MEYQCFEFKIENQIAKITMSRPETRNAMNPKFATEFQEIINRCQEPDVSVVIISGTEPAFSAGGDLKKMIEKIEDPDFGVQALEALNQMILDLRNLEKPVIAAINGHAVGAGLSLALACDFRISVPDAIYSCAFINIGLIPDCGSSFFLTRLVGYAKAVELMMLGENFTTKQANEWGIVNQVVEKDQLEATVNEFADKLKAKSNSALKAVKQLTNRALIADLPDQMALEAVYQKEMWSSKEFRQVIKLMSQKKSS